MSERKYVIAAGKDFLIQETTHHEKTAAEIVAGLRKFKIIERTQAEYAALPARDKAEAKKESGFLIGGHFNRGKKKSDCLFRSLITLDLDALTPESAAASIEALRKIG